MKNISLFFLLTFICIIASNCKKENCDKEPEQSNIDLKKGLLAYYQFNGNTADSSGNGNHGQLLNNGQLGYDEHGNYMSALDCYAHSQGMLVNNNGSIRFDTAFTVSLDVMIRDYLPNSFFNFINYSDGKGQSFSIGNNIFSTGQNWAIFINKETDFCSTSLISTDQNQYLKTNTEYQLTESWYNLIVSFHKGTLDVFVNGKLDKTAIFPNASLPFCSNSQLVIGNYLTEMSYGLNGKMDEVRLYNRVLNADEIAELAIH